MIIGKATFGAAKLSKNGCCDQRLERRIVWKGGIILGIKCGTWRPISPLNRSTAALPVSGALRKQNTICPQAYPLTGAAAHLNLTISLFFCTQDP
ncbi:MAG: hypothetical protein ACKO1F_04855 [Flammeovirgaceae bacterium]